MCSKGCTTTMVVHKHSVLADRSTAFSVRIHNSPISWTFVVHIFDVQQIFFGLAKGFGALTDVIATIAMCSMLASAKTGFDR